MSRPGFTLSLNPDRHQQESAIQSKTLEMATNRSNLPVPGSGIPKATTAQPLLKFAITKEPKSQISALSNQADECTVNSLKLKNQRKRLGRMVPIAVTSSTSSTISGTSTRSSSEACSTPNLRSTSSSSNRKVSIKPSFPQGPVSLYNGPHVAEPCVRDALLHVLQPCGHRVMTSQPEPCGSNCKGSDWVFANSATEDKFACAVCISRYVREHYQEKKALFLPSLDALERALGDFKAGWKETRIAKMERIWKNDALEEQTALETLGRFCEAIDGEPQEEDGEALVTAKRGGARAKNAEPSIPLMVVESKTIRLKDAERKPTMTRKNQLPAPSSRKPVKERTTVENERGRKKASRLPVGPMSWRKQMEVVK